MNRAVFLDRDGTVSEEVGYVNHIDRFRVSPWSSSAIRSLNEAGLRVVLVTNQSGIARGYFPEQLLHETHDKLRAELARDGARLDGIYYCPHHPEGKIAAYRKSCACRKPGIALLQEASCDLDIDLASSFFVGDKYLDLETGFRAKARGVLVLTGYGKGEYEYLRESWPRQPDFVAADLGDAAEWILTQIAVCRLTPPSEMQR